MTANYYPPTFKAKAFHCMFCNAYAQQHWTNLYAYISGYTQSDVDLCMCNHCSRKSYWLENKLIWPLNSSAPMPHPDMPESLLDDFEEARSIITLSPRGAAALLRLALQKLMVELGESGKDINKDIGSLVQKGLAEEVQQALDIVRVIGNESVHPGELDLRDDQETALQLFELINFIIEERISRKKRISSLFSTLPESKRKGIEDRDKDRAVTT
ncbi:DUF4145 domain-containing protein [Paenibacillus glucanolyticus]|uniref:DUF4145 domain-containing protein n=1 Tax=Paenibacillus glucanolyticus TaxID=59843 RepID=UPI00128C0F55|nr:DUF4145 domain-containing protein [Paenibacillus glucanolyticus]MPY20027.1 DUF4145 domain-containing protein [Paenibacillus glucanolyticus]